MSEGRRCWSSSGREFCPGRYDLASLKTHKYDSIAGPDGQDVFEAYAQNNTPGAYRVFFVYGPDRLDGKKRVAAGITIVAITPHP